MQKKRRITQFYYLTNERIFRFLEAKGSPRTRLSTSNRSGDVGKSRHNGGEKKNAKNTTETNVTKPTGSWSLKNFMEKETSSNLGALEQEKELT